MLQDADVVWFDLPGGRHLKSAKLMVLEQIFNDVHLVCNGRGIPFLTLLPRICMQNTARIPHKRWMRMLEIWQPKFSTICTCQVLDAHKLNNCGLHTKFHLYYNNMKALRCMTHSGDEQTGSPLLRLG